MLGDARVLGVRNLERATGFVVQVLARPPSACKASDIDATLDFIPLRKSIGADLRGRGRKGPCATGWAARVKTLR